MGGPGSQKDLCLSDWARLENSMRPCGPAIAREDLAMIVEVTDERIDESIRGDLLNATSDRPAAE
jgi:hypothetical protein